MCDDFHIASARSVSQVPQDIRFFRKQATCDGRFAHSSTVVPHFSIPSMSGTVCLQQSSKVDVEHCHMSVCLLSHFP